MFYPLGLLPLLPRICGKKKRKEKHKNTKIEILILEWIWIFAACFGLHAAIRSQWQDNMANTCNLWYISTSATAVCLGACACVLCACVRVCVRACVCCSAWVWSMCKQLSRVTGWLRSHWTETEITCTLAVCEQRRQFIDDAACSECWKIRRTTFRGNGNQALPTHRTPHAAGHALVAL